MISEHQFAGGYASVWHSVAPLSDGFWQVENRLTARFAPPLASKAPASLRGLVNETAFSAFCELQPAASSIDRATIQAAVDAALPNALAYVNRFVTARSLTVADFDDSCRREAGHLVLRLLHFFLGRPRIQVRPAFSGCGLISACEGDLVVDGCLYEIKAGERGFRVTDLRQLLVYSALAYASRSLGFHKVGLLNPRTGVEWTRTLDDLCTALGGARANDLLPTLVTHFSQVSISR